MAISLSLFPSQLTFALTRYKKNAFLYCHLKEIVYMEHPLRFINQELFDCNCLFKKSLYSLKQTPFSFI